MSKIIFNKFNDKKVDHIEILPLEYHISSIKIYFSDGTSLLISANKLKDKAILNIE